jgi:predicted permease
VLGDLEEEFVEVVETIGLSGGHRWYWRQAWRCLLSRRPQVVASAAPSRERMIMRSVMQDVRFAIRLLCRAPGFTAIAVASLAIGIGANTALFAIVDAVLFRPLAVDTPDRLVDVYAGTVDQRFATSSYPDYLDLRTQNHVLADLLAFSPSTDVVELAHGSRLLLGEVVSGNYFQLLGIRPEIGRTLVVDDDRPGAPRTAMISHRLWVTAYGASPGVAGQVLHVHRKPYTIVGVVPPTFTGMFPMIAPDLWTPIHDVEDVEPGGLLDQVPSPTGTTRLDRRGDRWLFLTGRLQSGLGVAAATANLTMIMQQLAVTYPETDKGRRLAIVPTRDVRVHPDVDPLLLPIGAGLMTAVGLLLLITCANIAGLLLARASARHREIGLRLALGASRRRIVQQLLTESALVAIVGAALGTALAWLAAQGVASIALPLPVPVSLGAHIDVRVLTFTGCVTILTTLVAGLVPALKATAPNLVAELKDDQGRTTLRGRRWTLRDGLVALQIAIAMVLLVSAGLLVRSLAAAHHTDLGFRTSGVAVLGTDLKMLGYSADQSRGFFDRALAQVRAIPGVTSAGFAARLPFEVNHENVSIFLSDRPGPADQTLSIDATWVSPEYFQTLGIPLVQGRNFTSADTATSAGVVIVNAAFARRYWPNQPAIGHRLRTRAVGQFEFEVVGVSADYKVSTVGESPTPYLHFAFSQRPDTSAAIVAASSGDADMLLVAMRQTFQALEPETIYLANQTMETEVNVMLLPARIGAGAVGAVGILATGLAAIGLYGVIAYAVSRRTREIGIRVALGARHSAILALLVRQGLTLALVGVTIGSALAWAAARSLSGALYGVGTLDPFAWSVATTVLLLVALVAHVVPARRALSGEPLAALKTD